MMLTSHETPLGKRERNRIERRNAILDVAAASFMEDGYARTSMSSIAARLGGSKGTLWSYFSSKEELFAAFIDRDAQPFTAELETFLREDPSLRGALEKLAARLIARVRSSAGVAVYRAVAGESGKFPEIGRIFYERGPGSVDRLLCTFLADQIQKGALGGAESRTMAQSLISLCTGAAHMRVVLGVDPTDSGDPAREAQNIVAVFLAAFER